LALSITYTPLPSYFNEVTGINNKGDIVGRAVGGNSVIYLHANGVTDFIPFPLGTLTSTGAVNDWGEVVGTYDSSGKTHGFFMSSTHVFAQLDVPGATATTATGINNIGQITGNYVAPPETSGPSHSFIRCPDFLCPGGAIFYTIDEPGQAYTQASFINNQGIAGGSAFNPGGLQLGFIRVPPGENFRDVVYPNAPATLLTGINKSGLIVGWADFVQPNQPPTLQQAFVLTPDGMFINAGPPGNPGAGSSALNDRNQFLGNYFDGTTWHYYVATVQFP
jgi:hypothetical protein